MAIATFSDLKAAITNWFHDRTDLAAYTEEFIALAEAYFNAELRCREMETVTSLTPTNGVCTLPADYIEYITVVEETSPRRILSLATKEVVERYYPTRPSGLSHHFMIVGDDLTALPMSGNDIELTYYAKIPALSNANPTNWLLAKMPNLYLHASLMYAAEFVGEDDMVAKESLIVEKFRGYLQALDRRAKFASVEIQLTGPTP